MDFPQELGCEVLPGLRAELICAYEGMVFPEARRLRVEDGGWTAWGVLQGRVQVQSDSNQPYQQLTASPGAWLLLPALPRDHFMSTGTSLLSLRFRLDRADGLPVFSSAHPVLLRGVEIRSLLESGRSFLNRLNGGFSLREDRSGHDARFSPSARADLADRIAIRAGLLDWMSVFFRAVLSQGWALTGSAPPSFVAVAMAGLQRFDPAVDSSVESVAERLSISVSHLRRKFQEEIGIAPSVWRARQRLEAAQLRLRNSRDSIKSIAWDLGFATVAHFSAWFRKQTGLSPSGFRARNSPPGV